MTHVDTKSEFWHKLLTIMVTISIVVLTALTGIVLKMYNAQKDIEITMAVMAQSIITHNISAGGHIENINSNTERIYALEEGQHLSTHDRITKVEALEALDGLKKWVEKNYKRK